MEELTWRLVWLSALTGSLTSATAQESPTQLLQDAPSQASLPLVTTAEILPPRTNSAGTSLTLVNALVPTFTLTQPYLVTARAMKAATSQHTRTETAV